MNDSGMYVGACHQVCDVTIDHAWMENNALGYSGTNSGGAIVIENSQFDDNQDGVDTNTQIAGDPPPPQNGACPNGATSPVTHTHSCWVFIHNNVHDNNNGDVPEAGDAAAGPIGTGMTLSGGRNDTVMDNTFSNNGAWGILFVPYPDSGTPSLHQKCANFGGFQISGLGCVFEPEGDALHGNTFVNDGYFGNPSNADFGQIVLHSGPAVATATPTTPRPRGSAPPNLEQLQPTCGVTTTTTNTDGTLVAQVECDSRLAACPAGANYPPQTGVHLAPLPHGLPTMADPCAGVPANAWCPSGGSTGSSLGRPGGSDAPQPASGRPRRRPSPRATAAGGVDRSGLSRDDAPGLERHRVVAARRLVGPVRDRPGRSARRRRRSTPSMSSSARPGSRPLVGSSSTRTGPGASRARATARRRRSPPDRATPSSPTGVSSPWGSAATQASRRAARSASAISVLGGVGPAEGEVGPHRAGEQLRPLVGQRAGGRGRRPGAGAPRPCRRARACRSSSGQ